MDFVFQNVKTLKIDCSGTIILNDKGELKTTGNSIKFTQKGATLKISSSNKNISSTSTVYANVIGNVGDHGSVVICGDNYGIGQVSYGHVGGNMVFNNYAGSTVRNQGVFNNYKASEETNVAAEYSTTQTCKLESSILSTVDVKGNARFTIQDGKILSKNLTISLTGNGTILLPAYEFDILHCNLTGNGDILGVPETKANVAHFNLTGNGDISDICITKSGTCNLTGNGDISLTKIAGAKVTKNSRGFGEISIEEI